MKSPRSDSKFYDFSKKSLTARGGNSVRGNLRCASQICITMYIYRPIFTYRRSSVRPSLCQTALIYRRANNNSLVEALVENRRPPFVSQLERYIVRDGFIPEARIVPLAPQRIGHVKRKVALKDRHCFQAVEGENTIGNGLYILLKETRGIARQNLATTSAARSVNSAVYGPTLCGAAFVYS